MNDMEQPYFTVEKDGIDYVTIRVAGNGDRQINKRLNGLSGAIASGIRAARAEGIGFRYGQPTVTRTYLTIAHKSGKWWFLQVLPTGHQVSGGERMKGYGRLDAAVKQCRVEQKRTRHPIYIDLDAEVLSA
jgi:hypothetical protein